MILIEFIMYMIFVIVSYTLLRFLACMTDYIGRATMIYKGFVRCCECGRWYDRDSYCKCPRCSSERFEKDS